LLDECLDRHVAEALSLVGYNFTSVSLAFPGRSGVTDPEIIDWVHKSQAVWVHADNRARRQYRILIIARNIRTLWVYRPGGKMGGAEQLRILAYILPDLLDRYRQHPSRRHYMAYAQGQPPRTRVRLRRCEI
jgi:hypothetical protein